jgi:NADH pyrophosphatase NudC (nudix superfamily)
MMGCRAVAEEDVDGDDGLHDARQLPNISFDEKEMFDVRWFHKDEVRGAMDRKEAEIGTSGEDHENSSHAQLVDSQLNFPGRQSLARLLLTQWASE